MTTAYAGAAAKDLGMVVKGASPATWKDTLQGHCCHCISAPVVLMVVVVMVVFRYLLQSIIHSGPDE